MEKSLTAEFWNNLYDRGHAPWDLGFVAPGLKEYIDTIENKELQVLVPGAGDGYDVEYLFENGFKNTILLDYSDRVVAQFQKRFPLFPEEQILIADFFQHNTQYDLILEHSFFSALLPVQRPAYTKHMAQLLTDGGKLVGLVFDEKFAHKGPPFCAPREEYLQLFEPYFNIIVFELYDKSVGNRAGFEYFFVLEKK